MNESFKAELRNCKTSEELLKAAQDNGFELTDEELSCVSGGAWDDDPCDTYVCQKVCKSPNGSTQDGGPLQLM